MRNDRSVAVIIVNWNGRQATSRCIQSLHRVRYANVHIIVVDNGSADDSVSYLTREYPEITLVDMHANTGFAVGANAGIRRARERNCEFFWILNNDVRVTPASLSALVSSMERDHDIGMAGSVLVEMVHGNPVSVKGGSVNFITGIPSNDHKKTGPNGPDYIKGASILLRAEAVADAGCFDESFFLYWEDTDLCFRMRSCGWKLSVAEDSLVIHEGHGSMSYRSPEWDYHFTRSSLIFFHKHARFPLVPIAVSVTGRIIMRLLQRKWANAAILMQAIFGSQFFSIFHRAFRAGEAGNEKQN